MNDDDLYCTPEQADARLSVCKTCEKFEIPTNPSITKCAASGCNISMMISFKFKECPLEKW